MWTTARVRIGAWKSRRCATCTSPEFRVRVRVRRISVRGGLFLRLRTPIFRVRVRVRVRPADACLVPALRGSGTGAVGAYEITL